MTETPRPPEPQTPETPPMAEVALRRAEVNAQRLQALEEARRRRQDAEQARE